MTTEPDAGAGVCRDRLTGLDAAPETRDTLIGRWVVRAGGQLSINSVPAADADFLVPDPSGRWSLITPSGDRLAGAAVREQLPDELEADSVRAIGDRLERLRRTGASWLEWLDVVPLVPGISEQVDLQPLERHLRTHFGHLEAVCRKPSAHLRVEVERLPVSRARRIPASAAGYLASHTEDWERPSIRGILPKRILAEVRHDEYDIYENRVTARLIDNLAARLDRRIRVLRHLLEMFRDKEDYSGALRGTYQLQRRIAALWGEAIDASEERRKAEDSLRELESLKYKLMSLRDSALYREVPRRAYVPTTLESTNLFANDPHYRRVAELWHDWARTGAGSIQSPGALHDEGQRLCRGMDAFSMLLIVRALDMLGYEPSDADVDRPIDLGVSLGLHGFGVVVTVRWREDGGIVIELGRRQMVVVALATDLSAGADEQVRAALARLEAAATAEPGAYLAVVYLASSVHERRTSSPGLGRSLHTVGNDPMSVPAGGACLPVSPWEIVSTEGIARALRWFSTSARFLEHPIRVEVPDAARETIRLEEHSQWLVEKDDGSVLELRRPPERFESDQIRLESLVERSRADLDDARARHRTVSEKLRRGTREGKTGDLNRRKREAHAEVSRHEARLEALATLHARFVEVRDRSIELRRCPSCGTTAAPARGFEAHDSGCFRCVCAGCRTEWATRLCSNAHRYAVMLPGGEFEEADVQEPGWVDWVYGGDLLALPARRSDGGWGFACPDCGQIS